MSFDDFDWLERFRDYLKRMARIRLAPQLRRKLDASDIVQQTMLQAHGALSQFRGSNDRQRAAWLRRILIRNLKRAVRDFYRSKRDVRREIVTRDSATPLVSILPDEHSTPSQHAARNEQAMHMSQLLDGLGDLQREAVKLYYIQELSLAEVAERLDRSSSAVAGLLHRALVKLRGQLQMEDSQ